ncbi:tRNA wybutosine-synthesizing protein 5-like [Haliotis rubra]|uniref:tRNA wybutosine-synthesizing protein 5-like n=1 Tax=Haliotis rubra TaxID=36100 RepID=UPI001EE51196|nr:tRNA wybutosine-synthesizing protein 5-like [Haliotis rubra]
MNGDNATSIFRTNYDLPVIHNATKDIFLNDVYPKRKPVILRGIDIGPCREKWSVDHLRKFGGDKEVKIHVSTTPQMDFLKKNFVYRSLPFSTFVQRAAEERHSEFFLSEEEHYYLRALGDDPRKDIADIHHQFPELAADIHLPEFYEPSKFYSSVFRIASPGVQLWTHYDVMDNLLIQVNGRKRVVLFSPREVENLYLNGDKSEVIDIDNPDLERFPKFPDAERHEGFLDPGDILFIPALWFHNVISLEFGVAVNVFWKHLSPNLYDHKDTYGNKDPQPAARATQILDRALKTLEELPPEYRDFYARRLVTRIQTKAYMKQDDSVS